MGDAVIVSAAAPPSAPPARARCSTSTRSTSPRHAVGEALKRSGIPADDVDDIVLGEVAPGRRRHRPLRRHRARADRRARRRAQPALRVGHGARCRPRPASITAGHGHGRDRRRRGVDLDLAVVDEARARHRRRCSRGCRRATRRRPTRPRSTCRSRSAGTPRRRPTSPARRWTTGRTSRTMRAVEGDRRRPLRGRDLPDRGEAAATARRPTFSVDEHPRRDTTMEKLASLKPLHPEIEDFSITAGNSSGLNDGAAAMVIVDGDYAEEHGLEPLADRAVVGVVGVAARRHGPRRRRSRSRRRSSAPGSTIEDVDALRDQRGVRVDVRRVAPACSASRTRSRT